VWLDPRLNSGVQFRSHAYAENTPILNSEGKPSLDDKGQPRFHPAGRVYGYQCELDVDPVRNRWWVGGIYEEARRLWLFPGPVRPVPNFGLAGAVAWVPGTWNHLRIEAVGPRLRTWVNGRLRADLTDGDTAAGFIGLQVHSVADLPENRGLQVRFRNVRIQKITTGSLPELPSATNSLGEAEASAGWKLLWDGKSSAGWRSARKPVFPDRGWKMEAGVLSVAETGGREADAGGDIITVEQYSDFELSVDFRLAPGANSGIKYFVDPTINQGAGSAIGLEFQLLDDTRHVDANLGKEGNRTLGSLYDLIAAPYDKPLQPPGEWNTARIVAQGRKVQHWLNGKKLVEFERGSPDFRKRVAGSKYAKWPAFGELPAGHILLQDHGNEVSFRNIKLRPLSPR
jgi:hypothetical protein